MATKSKSKTEAATSTPSGVARTQANRKRRLTQLLKQQPNNKQIQLALQEVGTRRKAPVTPQWSHSSIQLAKLFKLFTGRAPKELFSANPTIQQAAMALPSKRTAAAPVGRVDFSIGARAFLNKGSSWN